MGAVSVAVRLSDDLALGWISASNGTVHRSPLRAKRHRSRSRPLRVSPEMWLTQPVVDTVALLVDHAGWPTIASMR